MHAGRRGEPTAGHAEFLERVREGERQVTEIVRAVVRSPVELILDTVSQSTRHRDRNAVARAER